MSDPITASIEIGISAIKASAAIATWWEVRKRNQREDGQGAPSGRGAGLDEIFLVFSSLGQRLMALDVINYDALPQALEAVIVAMDTSEDALSYELGLLDPVLQYLVACAFVFCAACHPMPIYYGYGCGVMNHPTWANPEHKSMWNVDIDQAIAYLKSVPHPWKLLKKSPSQIGKSQPIYEKTDKKSAKSNQGLCDDMVKQFEKNGYPQPLPPNDNIKIGTWTVPFATYGGTSIYAEHGHNFEAVIAWQQDPGRFLYAWTVGEQADLRPGQAITLAEDHIGALAAWLEGLNGITFKVLLDSELDWSKINFKSSTKKVLKAQTGSEHGIRNIPDVIVRNPDPAALLTAQLDMLHMVSMSVPAIKAQESSVASANPPSPPTSPASQASPQSTEAYTPMPQAMPASTTSEPSRIHTEAQMPFVDVYTPSTAISPQVPLSPPSSTITPSDSLPPLPPDWEVRLTPDGRPYYANLRLQTTTWERPAPVSLAPLPPGWEERFASDGRPYYLDHYSKSTTWDRPSYVDPMPPTYENAVPQTPVSLSPVSSYIGMPHSEGGSSMTAASNYSMGAFGHDQDVAKPKDNPRPPPQKHRELCNTRLYKGPGKTICWAGDMPVTPDIYEQLSTHQHESSYIRHTAIAGEISDLPKLDYTLRQAGRTELVIGVNMYSESTYDTQNLNDQLIKTLGSTIEELGTHSFSRELSDRCNGSPLTGIVVCILIHRDRMKEVPWLRRLAMSFLWDLPSSVPISDSKRSSVKFYDDAQKDTRKILGKDVKVILNEYTTTFRLPKWIHSGTLMPDVASGGVPIQMLLCSTYRPWIMGTVDWFKEIGNLLDARLCISVRGGRMVTAESIEKQWQLSKNRRKPSESGTDIWVEDYLT